MFTLLLFNGISVEKVSCFLNGNVTFVHFSWLPVDPHVSVLQRNDDFNFRHTDSLMFPRFLIIYLFLL